MAVLLALHGIDATAGPSVSSHLIAGVSPSTPLFWHASETTTHQPVTACIRTDCVLLPVPFHHFFAENRARIALLPCRPGALAGWAGNRRAGRKPGGIRPPDR